MPWHLTLVAMFFINPRPHCACCPPLCARTAQVARPQGSRQRQGLVDSGGELQGLPDNARQRSGNHARTPSCRCHHIQTVQLCMCRSLLLLSSWKICPSRRCRFRSGYTVDISNSPDRVLLSKIHSACAVGCSSLHSQNHNPMMVVPRKDSHPSSLRASLNPSGLPSVRPSLPPSISLSSSVSPSLPTWLPSLPS